MGRPGCYRQFGGPRRPQGKPHKVKLRPHKNARRMRTHGCPAVGVVVVLVGLCGVRVVCVCVCVCGQGPRKPLRPTLAGVEGPLSQHESACGSAADKVVPTTSHRGSLLIRVSKCQSDSLAPAPSVGVLGAACLTGAGLRGRCWDTHPLSFWVCGCLAAVSPFQPFSAFFHRAHWEHVHVHTSLWTYVPLGMRHTYT